MNILILGCKDYPFMSCPEAKNIGGIEKYVDELVEASPNDTFFIVTRLHKGQEKYEEIKNARIWRVGFLNTFLLRTPTFIMNSNKITKRILKENNIDEIHAHEPIAGSLAGKLMPYQYTLFLHSMGSKEPGSAVRQRGIASYERTAHKFAKNILVVSPKIAEAFNIQKYDVFAPIINKAKFQNTKPFKGLEPIFDKKVVCFIGRLHPIKRVTDLIRAFRIIALTHDDCHLLIVGDGPDRENIELEVSQTKNATMLGAIKQVERILPFCKLMVLPSASEGCNHTILEAIASGVPVIATDVGEAYRFVPKELLYTPGDVNALAFLMKKVLYGE